MTEEELLRQLLLEGTPQDPATRDPELDPLGPPETAETLPLTIEERAAQSIKNDMGVSPVQLSSPVVLPGQDLSEVEPATEEDAAVAAGVAEPVVPNIGVTPPAPTAPALRTNIATGAVEQNPAAQSADDFIRARVAEGFDPRLATALASDPAARARFERQVQRDEISVEGLRRKGEADQDFAAEQERIAQERAQELEKIQTETANALDELRTAKIDPNRKWNSLSTGRKITAIIGMVLSGIAGKGKTNQAIQIIDRFIERDIQAQRENLANKRANLAAQKSLYSIALQKFGSEEAAAAASKAKLYADIASDMGQQLATLAPGARADRVEQTAIKAREKAVKYARETAEYKQKTFLDMEKNRRENEKLALEKAEFDLKRRKASGRSSALAVKGTRVFGVTDRVTGNNYIQFDNEKDARDFREKLVGQQNSTAAAQRVLARGVGRDIPQSELRTLNDADGAMVQLALQSAVRGNPSDRDIQIVTDQFRSGKSFGEVISLASASTRTKLLENFITVQEANLNRELSTFETDEGGKPRYTLGGVQLSAEEDPNRKDPPPTTPPPGEKVQTAAARAGGASDPQGVIDRAETLRKLWATGKASIVANDAREAVLTAKENFEPSMNALRELINDRTVDPDTRKNAARKLGQLERALERAYKNAEIVGR